MISSSTLGVMAGLVPQVEFTRLAALNGTDLGQARGPMPSTSVVPRRSEKDVDARHKAGHDEEGMRDLLAMFGRTGMATGPGKLTAAAALVVASAWMVAPRAAPVLDYDFFKARVEPIFLEKRAGHTRCYVCHAESNNGFRLERLSPGASFWSEEQSRRNFEMASRLVNPGDPSTSRLLQQPLAPEDGGNVFHSGGRQFASKDDAGWKTLADWVNGQKP